MTFGEPHAITISPDLAGLDAWLASLPEQAAVFLIWPRQGAPYLARTSLLGRRLRRLLGERATPSRWLNLRHAASRVEYWLVGSRLESALLHYQQARQSFPDSYLRLLKLRLPPYVKLMLGNPFPRTRITARLSGGRGLYYGPFRTRAAAEQFESHLLDLFQVRRCQENLAPSPAHPGCIYGEMNKCLRPCQQAVSAEEYRAEAGRLAAFLETGGRSLVEPLRAARDRLSQELRFEDAARAHQQMERVEEVLRLRDGLAEDIERLNGVAVTASAEPGAVELWFFLAGCWQPPMRFRFEAVEGRTVSLDHRLREAAAALAPARCPAPTRQEHLALLARWYYSSWRDGDWLPFRDLAQIPYRKLVNAIHRVAANR
ncbi:MAG: hypothetical protein ABSD56_01445 [Bryobacteraceae bacterium]